MFHSKKDFGPSKIQLPKRTAAPGKEFLHHLYARAIEFRGREVEVSWPDVTGTRFYGLIAKAGTQSDHTSWTLWQENGLQTSLIWQSNTNDLNLVTEIVSRLESGAPINARASQQGMLPANSETRPDDPYSNIRRPGSSLRQSFIEPRPSNPIANEYPSIPQSQQTTGPQPPAFGVSEERVPDKTVQPAPAVQSLEQGLPLTGDTPAANAARLITETLKTLSKFEVKDLRIVTDLVMSGDLDRIPTSAFLKTIVSAKIDGKLEVIGEESTGTLYFAEGQIGHATTHRNSGDIAVCEVVSWTKCLFKFILKEYTPVHSVNESLERNIMEGNGLLDQRKRLEEAGLTYESFLVKKHKQLGETEVRLFLTKGSSTDLDFQIKMYRAIGARCTLFDLLRDHPMERSVWVPLIFNLITCGLIEIKPPDLSPVDLFDFLGDEKSALDLVSNSLMRPETGILSYPSFLYFVRHEFFRFEVYGWPLTIVLFDISKRSNQIEGSFDLVGPREALVAIQRIELLKRPLDLICHFETTSYALLLPNTVDSSGAFLANRIMQALTAAPLSTSLDRKHLHLAFGVASVPADADSIELLIKSGKAALSKARNGDFPVVVANRQK
jgi:GGDEF domain-containing protein